MGCGEMYSVGQLCPCFAAERSPRTARSLLSGEYDGFETIVRTATKLV